ncbi:MAG TPA: hypothetical protein VH083_02545 [Myxococcales bacterium]|jgi:hypothetical protein|nr:hypothetical protein [Myxococcales bacterium]
MTSRRVGLYFAWSHPAESGVELSLLDNRFPALFELRRLFYPRYAELADARQFDQGVGGFLDHIQKQNFVAFAEQAAAQTGAKTVVLERGAGDGQITGLDDPKLMGCDTLVIISFDSDRANQTPTEAEALAMRRFLDQPGNALFVCPHHDVGSGEDDVQQSDFLHHGDRAIPPRQRFGGFARQLLQALGLRVQNQFGLRPAVHPDGSPKPVHVGRDRSHLLDGVPALNAHAHLPHFERLGDSTEALEVLVRQDVEPSAPPHRSGRTSFDALLQSRAGLFKGDLFIGDTTLFSSTAGGLENLRRLWQNLVARPRL